MKKIISLFVFFILSTPSIADTADKVLDAVSGKTSEFFYNLIPGEGHTEASIQINEEGDPDFEILAVRDISADEKSNLFTQFSLHNDDVSGDERYIANLGFGKRFLNSVGKKIYGNKGYPRGFKRIFDEKRISELAKLAKNYS